MNYALPPHTMHPKEGPDTQTQTQTRSRESDCAAWSQPSLPLQVHRPHDQSFQVLGHYASPLWRAQQEHHRVYLPKLQAPACMQGSNHPAAHCGPAVHCGAPGPAAHCGAPGPAAHCGAPGPAAHCGAPGPAAHCGAPGPAAHCGAPGPAAHCGAPGPAAHCGAPGPAAHCGVPGPAYWRAYREPGNTTQTPEMQPCCGQRPQWVLESGGDHVPNGGIQLGIPPSPWGCPESTSLNFVVVRIGLQNRPVSEMGSQSFQVEHARSYV